MAPWSLGGCTSYTFLDLAHDVLKEAKAPLTYQEIWESGQRLGFASRLKTAGKTPWQTLGAQLYVSTRDDERSLFVKASKRPTRFFLRSRLGELRSRPSDAPDVRPKASVESKSTYHERDLHPVLAYFVAAGGEFDRGRSVFTKTIHHETSKKSGYGEWTHPDMVGFYLPVDDWADDVIELNRVVDNDSLRLYSFELKKSLAKGNYRESYFQAVSNSTWAHQGYLCAAEIANDDDLLDELRRLASSFGIGIIKLNLEAPAESEIVYPAKRRDTLDWETINKLCEQNADFRSFLASVRIDFNARKVHRAEYDEPVDDIGRYVRETLKVARD